MFFWFSLMLAEVLLEPMGLLSQPNGWAGDAIGIIWWETEARGELVTNEQTNSPGTQHWNCINPIIKKIIQ